MADNAAQELNEQDLAERTGMPPVEEEAEESQNEGEEPTSDEDGSEEPTTGDEPEESEEESEDDGEEPDEDDESDDDGKEPVKRTVPYGKLKAEREKRQQLEKEIEDLKSNKPDVAESVKDALVSLLSKEEKEEPDAVSKAAKELGEDLGIDQEAAEKILRKAKELSSSNELPEEVQNALKELEDIKKEREVAKANEAFNTEWDSVIPELKKQYPGVTDQVLKEAKEKLYKLAHSKGYNDKELDYILFKEKKAFDTILKVSPHNKGGEKSKHLSAQSEDYSSDEAMVDIDDLTPEIMKQREEKEIYGKKGKSTEYTDMQIFEPIE